MRPDKIKIYKTVGRVFEVVLKTRDDIEKERFDNFFVNNDSETSEIIEEVIESMLGNRYIVKIEIALLRNPPIYKSGYAKGERWEEFLERLHRED